jgi:FixJ family two-component response regulator
MMSDVPIVHVVDDDAPFRTAVARLLRACGYEVALYESAARLLEASPCTEPGCILLDIEMPGVSGTELQDRLSERGNSLPIIFLTGHGDVPSSVRAIKAGAEDFLLKPVSKTTLLDSIERALARDRLLREQTRRLDSLRALVAP